MLNCLVHFIFILRKMDSMMPAWFYQLSTPNRWNVLTQGLVKSRNWMLWWSYRFEIWQASRQRCCWGACQISERMKKFKPESRGFESSRELAVRRQLNEKKPSSAWGIDEKLVIIVLVSKVHISVEAQLKYHWVISICIYFNDRIFCVRQIRGK